jgi:signal peptidase I
MPLFIISVLAIFVAFLFLLNALILFGLTKLFKVQNATYKKSIKILLFFCVASFLIEAFFAIFRSLISLDLLFIFIEGIIIFFVFRYFLKKYYQSSWKKSLGVYITFFVLTIIFSLAVITPIRYFLVEPLIVKENLMSPTLAEGDYLLIEKFDHNYQRGDVIAFYSNNKKRIFVRRIVGLPNENIEIINGNVLINNEILDESRYYNGKIFNNVNLKLNANEYFVPRDNIETNLDSQIFSSINKKDIIGKVFFVIRDSEQRFID